MSDVDGLIAAAEERWKASWAAGPSGPAGRRCHRNSATPRPTPTLARPRRPAASRSPRPGDPGRRSLLFWRHFGCSCGMDRAARLRREARRLPRRRRRRGHRRPGRAGARRPLPRIARRSTVPILSDPDRAPTRRSGCSQGTTAQILFDAPTRSCAATSRPGSACRPRGTARIARSSTTRGSFPGEFVVGTDGASSTPTAIGWCEDYPDPRVHVAAIRGAAGTL